LLSVCNPGVIWNFGLQRWSWRSVGLGLRAVGARARLYTDYGFYWRYEYTVRLVHNHETFSGMAR
jgi:hypothetical protein